MCGRQLLTQPPNDLADRPGSHNLAWSPLLACGLLEGELGKNEGCHFCDCATKTATSFSLVPALSLARSDEASSRVVRCLWKGPHGKDPREACSQQSTEELNPANNCMSELGSRSFPVKPSGHCGPWDLKQRTQLSAPSFWSTETMRS